MLEFIGLIVGISIIFGVILILLAKTTDVKSSQPAERANSVRKETTKRNNRTTKTGKSSGLVEEDSTTTVNGRIVQDPTKVPNTPLEYQRIMANATPFEKTRIEQEMIYNPLHPENQSSDAMVHYDEGLRKKEEEDAEYEFQEQQRLFEEQRQFEEQQQEELRRFEEQQQEQQRQQDEEFWNQQNTYDDDQNRY